MHPAVYGDLLMFLWMMDDETYRRRREAFVRAACSGYAPVTGQADPKAKEPASFDTKSHVDDRVERCQEHIGTVWSDSYIYLNAMGQAVKIDMHGNRTILNQCDPGDENP
jgi:hypothetical protein